MSNLKISTVVKLQPLEELVISVFNEYLTKHLSKYDFELFGVTGCIAQSIHRLKLHGAIFETIVRTEFDYTGRLHKRIACYRLVGWIWC